MTRWIVGAIVAGAVAIAAIVAVAAGSSSDDGSDGPAPPVAEEATEFRECMEANGADLPEPPGGGEPPEEGKIPPPQRFEAGPGELPEINQEALEECAELMPEGPGGSFVVPGAPSDAVPTPQN